jgi:hypothetical protein
MKITAIAIAAKLVQRKSQRLRRLPVAPITFLAIDSSHPPGQAVSRRIARPRRRPQAPVDSSRLTRKVARYKVLGAIRALGLRSAGVRKGRLAGGRLAEERDRLVAVLDTELLDDR